ncbi:hypothetical protein [Flammeovirga pacifica]|uniref:Glycosyltransferase RgtA/B/C/D-like domain-containing protein n=1 Tax=Flammeovirga pacifica TaxID=915059 RepID=A0A1S1Z0V9_FLAPC|nr:hypothetical protein [Flammeovirga pacifica]OHX66881.1 hypothetical protein NH26_11200 [Flammeovirga pacifica]
MKSINTLFHFFSIIACIVYTIQFIFGIGLSHDSIFYFHAAESIADKGVMLNPDGTLFLLWPPLYPFLLSLLIDYYPINFILLQIIGFYFVVYNTLKLSENINDKKYRIVIFLSILLSTSLLMDYKFMWSEIVFLGLLSTYVNLFIDLDKKKIQSSHFLLLTLLGCLLPLQRTAMFFIWVGFFAYVIFEKRDQIKKYILHFTISGVLGVMWHVYSVIFNHSRADFEMGGWTSVVHNLSDYSFVFTRWFLPINNNVFVGNMIFSKIIFTTYIIGLIILLFKNVNGSMKLIISGILSYLFFMIVTPYFSVYGGNTQEAERFLSIIYPFTLVVLVYLFDKHLSKNKKYYLLLFVFLVYNSVRFSVNYYRYSKIDDKIEVTSQYYLNK